MAQSTKYLFPSQRPVFGSLALTKNLSVVVHTSNSGEEAGTPLEPTA